MHTLYVKLLKTIKHCGRKEFQWSRTGYRSWRRLIFPSSSESVTKGFQKMNKSQTM